MGTTLLFLHEDINLIFKTKDVLSKYIVLLFNAVIYLLQLKHIFKSGKFSIKLNLFLLYLRLHKNIYS